MARDFIRCIPVGWLSGAMGTEILQVLQCWWKYNVWYKSHMEFIKLVSISWYHSCTADQILLHSFVITFSARYDSAVWSCNCEGITKTSYIYEMILIIYLLNSGIRRSEHVLIFTGLSNMEIAAVFISVQYHISWSEEIDTEMIMLIFHYTVDHWVLWPISPTVYGLILEPCEISFSANSYLLI